MSSMDQIIKQLETMEVSDEMDELINLMTKQIVKERNKEEEYEYAIIMRDKVKNVINASHTGITEGLNLLKELHELFTGYLKIFEKLNQEHYEQLIKETNNWLQKYNQYKFQINNELFRFFLDLAYKILDSIIIETS